MHKFSVTFERWVEISEKLSNGFSRNVALEVEKALQPSMGTLYNVPNFTMFKRSGEPLQDAILFTNDKFQTFVLNYVGDKFFSADFWKPNTSKPTVTFYANGRSLTDLLPAFPEIVKDPHPSLDIDKILGLKEDFVDSAKPTLEEPKPMVEVMPKGMEETEYEYGDPEEMFSEMATRILMLINSYKASKEGKPEESIDQALIITGSPGVGKTYTVEKLLKREGLKEDEDWVSYTGKATAASMYVALYENNGKIILFDDIDSVFKDDNAVNLLKGALDTKPVRKISWLSRTPIKGGNGQTIPQKFEYTGKVIFISNLTKKQVDSALRSRAQMIEVALRPLEMVDYMESKIDTILPDVAKSTKRVALDMIRSVVESGEAKVVNMRTLIKAVSILLNARNAETGEPLPLDKKKMMIAAGVKQESI